MSSTATPQAPPTEQVYGIAKRMSLDLEKYPLHTHGAILSMMTTMARHREATEKFEMESKITAAQNDAMELARQAHTDAAAKRNADVAAQIVEQSKPPRMSIVVGENGKLAEEPAVQ